MARAWIPARRGAAGNVYVLDDESGLKDAGAILATFGVGDTAVLADISGRFAPRVTLPFALARTLQAVVDNKPARLSQGIRLERSSCPRGAACMR